MREQLRRGGVKYLSFIILDLLCLAGASVLAVRIYLRIGKMSFAKVDYAMIAACMAIIDVVVTLVFNTLNRVLRRGITKELVESFKHISIDFLVLALFLFSTKQGAEYSRVTLYLAYGIYFVFIVAFRTAWKMVLRKLRRNKKTPTALLITTSGYVTEGLDVVETSGITVKGLFITDKTNEGVIRDIPVIVGRKDATALLCWKWIDRVYICGPENIDVPELLLSACKQMNIPVFTAPGSRSMVYDVIKIRTALQKDDKSTGLSFFESEHDIPFQVRRFYTIFESEQENQKGFHAHKQSWHLLFCPYGAINVFVDTGKEKKNIALSDPSLGLILHPSVWREMTWKKPGSVLCVAASGHYDSETLINDYDEYLKFLRDKEWFAVIESSEILGEAIA